MLLKNYSFETSLPECNTFAETINAIASLPDDVGEVLPYLASVIKLCSYDDNTKILTFKRDGKGIAMYSRQIAITKLRDREEAVQVLEQLKDLINSTYDNRNNIRPCYKKGGELKYLDVFKLLPGTNCGECGQATCLAFATMLVRQEATISQCSLLLSGQFEEKKKKMLEMLQGAGCETTDGNLPLDAMKKSKEAS
jgi:ArsR family metal-binding transcriptional regulator